MTLTQIECFITAAECGSFSKAGERMYISQQTMSRQIKALETELDFPLFDRRCNGVVLTNSGKVLYNSWREFLNQNRRNIEIAHDLYHRERKHINIGIFDYGYQKQDHIERALLNFNEKYPQLDIEYDSYSALTLLEKLQHGELHFIIIYATELEKLPSIKRIPISTDPTHPGIICSRKHPLSKRKELLPAHLAQETIGILAKDISLDQRARITEYFRNNGINAPLKFREYTTISNLKLALTTNKCVTIMFSNILDGLEDKLTFYPIDADWTDGQVCVAYTDNKYTSKAKKLAEELSV